MVCRIDSAAATNQRKNVILQAPTGAGKTRAALLPFLTAQAKGHLFPTKCIYSVPMRVLATQFHHDYRDYVEKAGRKHELPVTIQTGESPEDPEFKGAFHDKK